MANYPATYNFNLIQGSSWGISLTLVDDTNSYIDLSSSTFEAQIRDETGQTQYGAIDVEITEPVDGKLELSLDYLATRELNIGVYFYDLVRIQSNVIEPSGSIGTEDTREFVMRGMITVIPSYTPS